MVLGKMNDTSALLVSSLGQGIWDRASSDFPRVLIHCSPTNLDAAISLGEELINLFLKDFTDNQTQHELFCCIAHITRNFHVETCSNCNDFFRIDAVVSMFKDSSVSGTKEVKHH